MSLFQILIIMKLYVLLNISLVYVSYTKTNIFANKNGYSNLIKNVPYIAIYSPNPEVINSCYIQSTLNYKPSDKTILETLTFAYEQKLEAFKHQISN